MCQDTQNQSNTLSTAKISQIPNESKQAHRLLVCEFQLLIDRTIDPATVSLHTNYRGLITHKHTPQTTQKYIENIFLQLK